MNKEHSDIYVLKPNLSKRANHRSLCHTLIFTPARLQPTCGQISSFTIITGCCKTCKTSPSCLVALKRLWKCEEIGLIAQDQAQATTRPCTRTPTLWPPRRPPVSPLVSWSCTRRTWRPSAPWPISRPFRGSEAFVCSWLKQQWIVSLILWGEYIQIFT